MCPLPDLGVVSKTGDFKYEKGTWFDGGSMCWVPMCTHESFVLRKVDKKYQSNTFSDNSYGSFCRII